MQTNRLAALILTAALCLGTAACGSSDGDDAASTTTEAAETTTTTAGDDDAGDDGTSPEKAAFLEAADKICKESTDKINETSSELDSQEDFDDAAFEAFLKMAAQESTKQIAAVRALGFPEDDADELDAAFTTFEEAFAKVADDPANTLEYTGTPEFDEASTFLTEYGFEECGGGDTAG